MISLIIRLARNPLVRRVAVWLAPLIMTWVMEKISSRQNASGTTKQGGTKRSTKK